MTDCNALREDLKAYLDGELAPLARLAVRRHLAGCASCREEASIMEQVGQHLRSGDTGELTADLRARILSAVPAVPAGSAMPRRTPALFRSSASLRSAGAVAGSIVLVGVIAAVLFPTFAKDREKAGSMYAPVMPGAADRQAVAEVAPAPMARGQAAASARYAPTPGGVPFPMGRSAAKAATAGGQAIPAVPLPSVERKVAKSASITVSVRDVEKQSEQVERLAKEMGGFVTSNNLATGVDDRRAAIMTIRVPVAQFEAALGRLAALGQVRAKEITGEDITEKISDDEREKAVLYEEVQRLQRTGHDADQYQRGVIYEQARDAHIRLEQAKGRLELRKRLVALATITVTLSETAPAAPTKAGGFLGDMGDTFRAAGDTFLEVLRIPLLGIVWMFAYSPIWLPFALAGRYGYARYRKYAALREVTRWQTDRAQG